MLPAPPPAVTRGTPQSSFYAVTNILSLKGTDMVRSRGKERKWGACEKVKEGRMKRQRESSKKL